MTSMSDALRVLHLTDPHLHHDRAARMGGMDTRQSWNAVLDAVAAQPRPDLILLTGDIVHDQRAETYRGVMDDLSALGAPALLLPGNHDDAALFRAVVPAHGPVARPDLYRVGDWLVVLLDSTVLGAAHGHLCEERLTGLRRALALHPGCPTLVTLHHQPVPVGSAWLDRLGLDNAEALLAVIDTSPQVKALLWGHVHQDLDRCRGAVRLLATPSTCMQFRPNQDRPGFDDRAPGWRWLTLHPDGQIDTTVGRLPDVPEGLRVGTIAY